MRIKSSDISIASSSIDVKKSTKFEYLKKWDRQSRLISSTYQEDGEILSKTDLKIDNVEISANFKKMQKIKFNESIEKQLEDNSGSEELKKSIDGVWSDLRIKIIKDLMEHLTGKKIKLLDTEEIKDINDASSSFSDLDSGSGTTSSTNNIKNSQGQSESTTNSAGMDGSLKGWGIDYYYKETNYNKEGFEFSASGKITNENGQETVFKTFLQMDREKYEEIELSLKAGDALIDPLMIDFSGSGVSLIDMKFEFDLDADGETEMIHAPSAGTAFLAYDKNGNGVVDDGSELFGPSGGDGFKELSDLDDDGNGWIDENDTAFYKLKIWEKTADGNDVVSSLLDKDVGAIYCGHAASDYNLENQGEISGVIKETGIYLKESGGTGFIQEIDFVV